MPEPRRPDTPAGDDPPPKRPNPRPRRRRRGRRRPKPSIGRGRRLADELVRLWLRLAQLDDDGRAEFFRILDTFGIDMGDVGRGRDDACGGGSGRFDAN